MKIGIDIDDTICDTWEYIIPYLARYYNIDINYLKNINKVYEDALNISFLEFCKFAKAYFTLITPNVPVKPNVELVLSDFKKKGYEIVFITARSNLGYDDPYKISYDYLIKNNIPFDKLITGRCDKENVCVDENIDIFIDDSISHIEKVSKKNIDVLLFETKVSINEKRFTKVKNWNEVKKNIEVKYGYKNRDIR